ncbi:MULTISPECIES: ABC transporter permease subunit [Halobacteriales]|uniref:ABC transporter permease subunit n=1 Tax=Halobacteriales TaxID=2235 RepID=UPI001092C012|nr:MULTISPECIES: ABC transporter permease subunit [Halobacteriales]UHH27086.1 ABC transporter permease [Halobacterium noricense]
MARPRWFPLARKEARTILTSKGPWALAILLVLWGYRPSYVGWDYLGPDMTVGFVQVASTFLLPLGVLLLSYRSIVGERTSGSLKFVLGLPLTRTDILVGKILGRSAGIAIPVTAAALVLGLIGVARFGLFSPLLFLAVFLAMLLYVVVLVSIATAVSAVTTSTVRATGVIFGVVYLVLTVLWKTVAGMTYSNLTGLAATPTNAPADGLLFALLRISPDRAYRVLTNWILEVGNSGAGYTGVITKLHTPTAVNAYVVEAAFETKPIPVYLHEILGLVVLLLWLVVPLGLARYRFERGDLV